MTNAEIIKTLACNYYEDENILFLNTDCMKLMELLPDKFFNLAICDPEWGIKAGRPAKKPDIKFDPRNGNLINVKNNNYEHKSWDDVPVGRAYFDRLFIKSINQIIWGVNFFCEYYNFTPGRIIWDKLNGDSDQFDAEISYNSIGERIDLVRFKWSGMIQGKDISKEYEVANYQQGNKHLNEKRIHPCQKPIALYLWLLDNYAKPNDLIFDSHVGSASSLIACMQKGFKCIGTELDTDYFNDAIKRIKLERAKLDNKFYLPEESNLFNGV